MTISIEEAKKTDDFRVGVNRNRRQNASMTIYYFLLENRKFVFTAEELSDKLFDLGFERKDEKQIEYIVKEINKKRWRRSRPSVKENVRMGFYNGVKVFGIESEMI